MTTKTDHNHDIVIKELEIIKSIGSGNSKITLISKQLNKDRSNTNRTLKKLLKEGLIKKEKLNSKTTSYYLTPKCQQILGNILLTTKTSSGTEPDHKTDHNTNLRMEYIGVKFDILNVRHSWRYGKERKIALIYNDIDYNVANLKNNKIYSYVDQTITIKLSSKSVIIYFPEESTVNPQILWANILYRLPAITKKIENKYNLQLSEDITVVSQEVALMESALGNYAEKTENDKYYIFYDPIDGKPRWKLDKSKGVIEHEFMHRLFADEDFERINKDLLYDFVSTNALKPSEMTVKIESLEFDTSQIQINQENITKILYDLVDTTNILRERTFDPLKELKIKVKTIQDVIEYQEAVELLTEDQKKDFEEWLITSL